MGKPTICIGENKDAVTAKLISAFVFATRIVQFLFYLNPKFQASSSFLCLYWPVCVGPVRKPHYWFSHEAAHIVISFVVLFVSSFVLKFFVLFAPYMYVVIYLVKFRHLSAYLLGNSSSVYNVLFVSSA